MGCEKRLCRGQLTPFLENVLHISGAKQSNLHVQKGFWILSLCLPVQKSEKSAQHSGGRKQKCLFVLLLADLDWGYVFCELESLADLQR